MTKKIKKFAEINGEDWEVGYPLCSGCPEMFVGGTCGYEGNGCRFPESRIKSPRSFYTAFHTLLRHSKLSPQEVRQMEIKEFPKK